MDHPYLTAFAIAGGLFLAVVLAVIFVALPMNRRFEADCRAHGGAHVTYPYRSDAECWTEDGRRVFW